MISTPFPPWIKRTWASGADLGLTKDILAKFSLNTICQSAKCPNIAECWGRGTATIMVLGHACTRNCAYCSVPSGNPAPPHSAEPENVAQAVKEMQLRHAVITTVARDDLPDEGANHIAQTIRAIREANPTTTIEILVSDFSAHDNHIDTVLNARPHVFGHNIETVQRLYTKVRDRRFSYQNALHVLQKAANHNSPVIIKSALMVGHGETIQEVHQTLRDLRGVGCQAVCIGQYLRPTNKQRPVAEFIKPEQFKKYERFAYELGFAFAVAGPFVRSSYRSEALLQTHFARHRLALPASA